MSPAEREERERLEACQASIRDALQQIGARLGEQAREVKSGNTYMWEARRDMDHIEKIAVRQGIEQTMRSADILEAQQKKLVKLVRAPYFGRVDFAPGGQDRASTESIYVGVHHFRDEATGETLIYDWRAPVSNLFYDHEIGPASYTAPCGEVSGELRLKRQFRIREGHMEFMLESDLHVVDDVLQHELSRAADAGMRNIVATIQRDQNIIIRNEEAQALVIQGVAGSGKTSIALHRIAFLLYRFKDTLSADDILIVSPNRVFADYIGNVLPELGEEQVSEIAMDSLADELLGSQYRFETFFEQTERLLDQTDPALEQRIALKSSLDFVQTIEAYAEHLEASSFEAREWRLGRKILPAWHFEETWRKHRGAPLSERMAHLVRATEHQIGIHYHYTLEAAERKALRNAVRSMIKHRTLRNAYKGLFEWLGQPELFKPVGGKLEHADVFPLIYLRMRLEGVENPRRRVKHLLIDEMQDYAPLQYAVLAKLFPCRKTVLGDVSQAVSLCSASNAGHIRAALKSAICVTLNRSYRSTWEIMRFAQSISPNPELQAIERHGAPPRVITCKRAREALERIQAEIAAFGQSSHRSLALIAKTQDRATSLHTELRELGIEARLLDCHSAGFSTGITVCTAHLAKGLEFDRVIVADANARNYHTEMDRNLLYVACTRAMHDLTLFAVGEPSRFLAGDKES